MISGIGYNSGGKYQSRENGKQSYGYTTWKHMIERCYDPKYLELFPTYLGCSVEPYFLDFQNFMAWATEQQGFGRDKTALDKDLLKKGNKEYNRKTCVFIPRELNGALVSCAARRGEFPVGVSLNQRKYMVTLSYNGKNKNLGRYSSVSEAYEVYKKAKELRLKQLAEKYKNDINPLAYDALMRYTVDITD